MAPAGFQVPSDLGLHEGDGLLLGLLLRHLLGPVEVLQRDRDFVLPVGAVLHGAASDGDRSEAGSPVLPAERDARGDYALHVALDFGLLVGLFLGVDGLVAASDRIRDRRMMIALTGRALEPHHPLISASCAHRFSFVMSLQ